MYSSEALRARSWKKQISGTRYQEVDYEPVPLHEHLESRGDERVHLCFQPSIRRSQDVDYEPIPSHDHSDDQDVELLVDQCLRPSIKIPWSAVVFAGILSIGGAALLCCAILLLSGYIDPKYVDRTWPVVVLGFIMFIPGIYHLRIALYAFLDRPGYSFDDIPDFD